MVHDRVARRFVLTTLLLGLLAGPLSAGDEPGRFPIHTWQVDEHTSGMLVEDHRVPVVHVRLEFPAGTWSEWGERADLDSALRVSMYDPGGELRRRSEELAAGLTGGADDRFSWISAACLKRDLPAVVELIRDTIGNDHFDREELSRWKQRARIEWRATETDVRFQARRLLARAVFAEDDPRREPFENRKRIETEVRRLKEIRDLLVRLPGRTIGLAGDLTPGEAESLARGLLPPALPDPGVDPDPALRALRPRSDRRNETARVRRLTQVYFGLARESLAYDDPDYPAFVLANHVLGGHFYSRLYVALRHEGGETYGAFARSEGGIAPGPFVVGSFTNTANAAHAEETLRETLRVFHEKGITEDERAEAASHFLGARPFTRRNPEQVLLRRLAERRDGLPAGFFDDLPDRMAEIDPVRLAAFVREYYDPVRFVLVRVAPER